MGSLFPYVIFPSLNTENGGYMTKSRLRLFLDNIYCRNNGVVRPLLNIKQIDEKS